VPPALGQLFEADLRPLAGHYGLVIESIDRNQRFAFDEQREFPSASVYKLALAAAVLQRVKAGQLALADVLTILPEDGVEPEPDGGLDPGEATFEAALQAMLSVSSNSAAHALLRVLGREQVNQQIAALGLAHTHIPLEDTVGAEPPEAVVDASADVAVTTAADTAHLLRLLATGQVLTEPLREQLYAWMQLRGEPRPVEESLPDGVTVAAKAGNLDRASNVAALVFGGPHTLTIAVFDDDVDPGDARLLIGRLARAAYDYYMLI
jgi:beta-lactamase class A